ncbi:expressed unknown protein [Seminavis robusta]|uniref:Uncharacterized protein n=2 Tax=Seminavis robusta TaxID=568900 RepID=A0A9N8DW39_9STRA|nr:expressed unknown protein [Seminavis robusta]|eukprot:Sro401_g135360.1 n/a (172) ;mRNA; f:67005-67520
MNKPISFFDMQKAWKDSTNSKAFSLLGPKKSVALFQKKKKPLVVDALVDPTVGKQETRNPLKGLLSRVTSKLDLLRRRKKAPPLSFEGGNGDDHDWKKQIMATSTTLYSTQLSLPSTGRHDEVVESRRILLQFAVSALLYPILLRWVRSSIVLTAVVLPHCWLLSRRRDHR